MAQIRHKRPVSGRGFQVKALTPIEVDPSSLGSGTSWTGGVRVPRAAGRTHGHLSETQGQNLAVTV